VDLANQPYAEREALGLGESPLERPYVVEDFLDVGARRLTARLCLEDVEQRRLRAFDSRRGEGFAQEVWADQQMRIGDELPDAGEPSEGSLRVGKEPDRRRGQLERARDGGGKVRDVAVAPEGAPSLAEPRRCVVAELHTWTLPL